jgi:hypothetical protein
MLSSWLRLYSTVMLIWWCFEGFIVLGRGMFELQGWTLVGFVLSTIALLLLVWRGRVPGALAVGPPQIRDGLQARQQPRKLRPHRSTRREDHTEAHEPGNSNQTSRVPNDRHGINCKRLVGAPGCSRLGSLSPPCPLAGASAARVCASAARA